MSQIDLPLIVMLVLADFVVSKITRCLQHEKANRT